MRTERVIMVACVISDSLLFINGMPPLIDRRVRLRVPREAKLKYGIYMPISGMLQGHGRKKSRDIVPAGADGRLVLLINAGADQHILDLFNIAGFGFDGLGDGIGPFEIHPAAAFGFSEVDHFFNHGLAFIILESD